MQQRVEAGRRGIHAAVQVGGDPAEHIVLRRRIQRHPGQLQAGLRIGSGIGVLEDHLCEGRETLRLAGALEPLERRDELGEPELAGLERFETGGLKRFVGVGFGQLEQF